MATPEAPPQRGDAFDEETRAALARALPGFLAGRRWFGGKARTVREAALVDAAPLPCEGLDVRLVLAEVRYEEGAPERYVVPVALGEGEGEVVAAAGEGARRTVVRAVEADGRLARALVDGIGRGDRLAGAHGEIVSTPTRAFAALAAGAGDLVPRPLGAEQSNTSFRLGDRLVLKIFRRTDAGPNPELELGAFLTDEARFANVPAVAGGVEYRPRAGEPSSLAILQAFVANEGDAWAFTLREVRAFLERVRGREPPPADGRPLVDAAAESPPPALAAAAGGFLARAALLGRRTGELHAALASGRSPGFAPEPFSPADARALAAAVRAQVEAALALLRRRRAALSGAALERAEAVLAAAGELAGRAGWLERRAPRAARTRTHGDYHLGQVLFTGDDFVIIDFEGEPARPLAERRAKASPLRDVAGLLRSFHYAAHQGLADERAVAGGTAAGLARAEAWAAHWHRAASAAFLAAWIDAARAGGFLPDPGELRELLDVFLVEKAAYELAYELNNRPDWVALPLEGLLELAGAPGRAERGTT